jgi:hypothetical protein
MLSRSRSSRQSPYRPVNVRHRATEYLANLRLALLHPEIDNLPIALRVPVEGAKIEHGCRSLRPGSLTRLASQARALTGVSTAGGILGSPDHEQIPEQTSAAGVATDPPPEDPGPADHESAPPPQEPGRSNSRLGQSEAEARPVEFDMTGVGTAFAAASKRASLRLLRGSSAS